MLLVLVLIYVIRFRGAATIKRASTHSFTRCDTLKRTLRHINRNVAGAWIGGWFGSQQSTRKEYIIVKLLLDGRKITKLYDYISLAINLKQIMINLPFGEVAIIYL